MNEIIYKMKNLFVPILIYNVCAYKTVATNTTTITTTVTIETTISNQTEIKCPVGC